MSKHKNSDPREGPQPKKSEHSAKLDLSRLVDYVVNVAKESLVKRGEFLPMFICAAGGKVHTQEVIVSDNVDGIREEVQRQLKKIPNIDCYVVGADFKLQNVDSIVVFGRDREGNKRLVFVRYVKEGKIFKFDEPIPIEGKEISNDFDIPF